MYLLLDANLQESLFNNKSPGGLKSLLAASGKHAFLCPFHYSFLHERLSTPFHITVQKSQQFLILGHREPSSITNVYEMILFRFLNQVTHTYMQVLQSQQLFSKHSKCFHLILSSLSVKPLFGSGPGPDRDLNPLK